MRFMVINHCHTPHSQRVRIHFSFSIKTDKYTKTADEINPSAVYLSTFTDLSCDNNTIYWYYCQYLLGAFSG